MEKSGIDGKDTDGMDERVGIEMLGIDGTKSLALFVMSCIRLRDGASCAPAAWALAKRAARIMNRFIDFLLALSSAGEALPVQEAAPVSAELR